MSKEHTTRITIVVITVIKIWIKNIVVVLLYKSHTLLIVLVIAVLQNYYVLNFGSSSRIDMTKQHTNVSSRRHIILNCIPKIHFSILYFYHLS